MAAGDFTNVRVESTTYDSATIRYTYGNTNAISLYRSTDGSSYSAVQTIPAAYGSYPTIVDDTVSPETLYYYKLSDDSGSTFTSVVTVKTQKRFLEPTTNFEGVGLPAFTDDEAVNAENLELMRTQLEDYLNGDQSASPRKKCVVCPTNGALVLDCVDSCFTFVVKEADITDINSISINCEKLEIIFEIPDGTETEVCGWDLAAGFSGDECFQAPITSPVTMPVNMIKPNPCPVSRTRLTTTPCAGDYIYECYSKGSLFRSQDNANRNTPVIQCSCASISNGYTSLDSSGWYWTLVSGKGGKKDADHEPMAGMSIYFKHTNTNCAGAPSDGNIVDYVIGGFSGNRFTWDTVGKPKFGFAVNVPSSATMRNFTGHVLLFDFPNSVYRWCKYTGVDLLAGSAPTSTIGTIAMSAITPTSVNIIIDATPGNIYSIVDISLDNATQTETIAHSSITLTSEPLGYGVIWVANTDPGDHIASLYVRKEQSILWWG